MEGRREKNSTRIQSGGGLLKICSSLNQNESTFFTPFLRAFSLLSCSYTGGSCTGSFCGARSRISVFIISPREPTGAWRKVQGSNASAEQKIYNSNSRYSRNKKFTFIMQIDIKCCAVERNPLLYIFSPKLSWGVFREGSKGIYLQLRSLEATRWVA